MVSLIFEQPQKSEKKSQFKQHNVQMFYLKIIRIISLQNSRQNK